MQDTPFLDIYPPEPILCPAILKNTEGKEVRRTLRLRPLTLGDEKWRYETFKQYSDEGFISQGDMKPVCQLFVHQLYEEDCKWMCEQLGVEAEGLVEYMLGLPVESLAGDSLMSAITQLNERSHPEGGEVAGKKLKVVSQSSMRWSALLWFIAGKVSGVITLYVIGRYVNLPWLTDGIVLNSMRMTWLPL